LLVASVAAMATCWLLPTALAADRDGELPERRPPEDGVVTWRVTWDNDVVFDSDNQFSNGWSIQVHGLQASEWNAVGGTPAFGKSMARWFLPDRRTDLTFREGWSVGQAIQTPDDGERADLILDDVPYAAAIAVQNTWIAYDDRNLHGFGWLFGVLGPAALGEEVQDGFHNLIGSDESMGWDNQLENEPLINFYYERKWKLVRSSFGDLSFGASGALGNLVTDAEVKLEGRLGWHLPRGFLYVPDPIGRHLSYDSHMPPQRPATWALYGSLSTNVMLLGYSAFYDGNLFRDSHSIEHERVVESVVVGLHFQRRRWGMHLNVAFSTDVVDPYVAADLPDPEDDYGSIMFEFRH
jgi:hypothetical protein